MRQQKHRDDFSFTNLSSLNSSVSSYSLASSPSEMNLMTHSSSFNSGMLTCYHLIVTNFHQEDHLPVETAAVSFQNHHPPGLLVSMKTRLPIQKAPIPQTVKLSLALWLSNNPRPMLTLLSSMSMFFAYFVQFEC